MARKKVKCRFCTEPLTLTRIGNYGFRMYLHTGDQIDKCKAMLPTDIHGKPVNWMLMIQRKLKGLKIKMGRSLDEQGKVKPFGVAGAKS